jgi:hypothetical protein
MKIYCKFLLLFFFCSQFIFGQETPENIAESFFNFVKLGNYPQAVDYIISINPNLKNDSTFFNKVNNSLENAHARNGAYCGYEFIEKDQVTDSYVTYSYLIKYLNNPARIEIIFYKPRDKWQVNNIRWNPQGREQEGRSRENNALNSKNANRQKPANKVK